VEKKINKIIQLKRSICKGGNKNFLLVNQKGIDNISLDLLCREGILGLRRTKKKNMERISILCNAIPVNSTDDIDSTILGFAGIVYEKMIGEEKFTFIENVSNPFSGTILVKGTNAFLRRNTEEIIRDAIKCIKLCFEDHGYLLGGGEIELNASKHLFSYAGKINGEKKFGLLALSKSLTIIPEILSENEGKRLLEPKKNIKQTTEKNFDAKETVIFKNKKTVFDCFSSKKQVFNSVCSIAAQILQIDQILLGKGLSN
jgi:T-complex protein 1 subunit zeta